MNLSTTSWVGVVVALFLVLALIAGYCIGHSWLAGDPAAWVRQKYTSNQIAARAPAKSESPNVPTPALVVKAVDQGRIVAAMPEDVARATQSPPTPAQPQIQVPRIHFPQAAPKMESEIGAGSTLALPPVPQRLLDQSPPESSSSSSINPVPTELKVAPRRYLFNNLSEEVMQGKTVQVKPDEEKGYNPETFAPMGEDIVLALMNNVASNSFEVPVAAAVWTPFYFQGRRLLERGDKLLGTAQAGKNRDRILVTFTHLILKNGESIPMKAIALGLDGTVGIQGYMVGENLLKTLTPVLLQAVRGFSEAFENRTESTSNGLLGTVSETTLGNDLTTRGVEAGGQAMETISKIIAQDLEENRPYVLVIAGTTCRARLLEPLDVSVADYGK